VASNVSDPPLVGLTTYVERAHHGVWDEMSALLPLAYVSAVVRSGGVPLLLPPAPAPPETVLGAISAVVLTGGADVDPSRYGADAHSMTDCPRPDRDAWEAKLCLAALDAEIPVLAVCRGLQVMNVALGGTLHQHLPDLTGTDVHRVALGRMTPNHVEVEPDSTLAAIVGSTTEGMCHHHQAVDHPGRGLRVVARAADGTVEGMEIPGRGFAVGVQWHPESNDLDDRLFKSVVEAAAAYRRRRTR
jgi:putative glutamine amidotransferase